MVRGNHWYIFLQKKNKIKEAAHSVTVNGELVDVAVDALRFQHHGAACHRANERINLLKATIGVRIISCRGPVTWPPISYYLTSLDYFLWCCRRLLVYTDAFEENTRCGPKCSKIARKMSLAARIFSRQPRWSLSRNHFKSIIAKHIASLCNAEPCWITK